MKKYLTFIDMFAGIGGFRSGMEQAGHKCVGWIEWDKFARQSYQAMYNTEGEFNGKDIQQVRGSDLPDSDVWCFGFPCQDVSVSGKQAGLLNGKRSGLFFGLSDYFKKEVGTKKRFLKLYSLKTLKTCYQLMVDGDLPGCKLSWTKQGMTLNGQLSTLLKSSLRTGKESTLSDILEEQVPQKYFLSSEKAKKIVQELQ